jgi:hypothetical protein
VFIILLHWKWVAAVTKGFLKSLAGQARINYILNAALFVITTVIIFSGVMESQAVLPALGLSVARSPRIKPVENPASSSLRADNS